MYKRIVNIKNTQLSNIPEILETENLIIDKEEKISLYKKMQHIDEKSREVVYLRITGELSFKEIGTILNKTENWARITFYRAKNKLKEVDYNEKRM